MKYSELKNFTHKQLSSFTHQDLSLDKYELIAKAENSTIELPADVQNKLYELCTLKTVGDVAKILSSLITTIKNLNDLGLSIFLKECLDDIISFLNNIR